MTTTVSLTTEQRSAILTAIVLGFGLPDFLARHPDWPQSAVTDFWEKLSTEIQATQLNPGQYWGVPSEW